jgi:hypothetical protein
MLSLEMWNATLASDVPLLQRRRLEMLCLRFDQF